MSDFRTLRDALAHMGCLMVEGLTPGVSDTHVRYRIPENILDLRICGDALVALDVEAGVKALMEFCYERVYPGKEIYELDLSDLLPILKACGVHVPDEVVEARLDKYWPFDDEQGSMWQLELVGDQSYESVVEFLADVDKEGQHYTITITRKEGE